MSAIVQIWFKYRWSKDELQAAAEARAKELKGNVPGLQWKIFVNDESASETCGIYLFDSMETANAYANGERVTALNGSPDIDNVSVRVSEVMEKASVLADAPLNLPR